MSLWFIGGFLLPMKKIAASLRSTAPTLKCDSCRSCRAKRGCDLLICILHSQKSPSLEGLFMQHFPASGHLNDGLHDGALSRDGLGVRLVVALRLNQVDQFVGQVDVGLFQGVGNDRTQSTSLRRIVARDARR